MTMNETNVERKKTIQTFSDYLQRLTQTCVDSREFYLIKSIALYKSGMFENFKFSKANYAS